MDVHSHPRPLERVSTGIDSLDTILHGGFFRGSLYLIIGIPGGGKTILANQIAYSTIANGGKVSYFTVLAETHSRLFSYLNQFDFFNYAAIGDTITYVNGYQSFKDSGLGGLLQHIKRTVQAENPTLLILDGIPMPHTNERNDPGTDDFIHELQTYSEYTQCTSLVLTPANPDRRYSHALTMADGHLELTNTIKSHEAIRTLVVHKLRGSDYIPGDHVFTIAPAGIVFRT